MCDAFKPCCFLVVWLMLTVPARGVSVTGTDWIVHFNLPDQLSTWNTGSADEYGLRTVVLDHINALQTNHSAWLATYTFSGSNYLAGGADHQRLGRRVEPRGQGLFCCG